MRKSKEELRKIAENISFVLAILIVVTAFIVGGKFAYEKYFRKLNKEEITVKAKDAIQERLWEKDSTSTISEFFLIGKDDNEYKGFFVLENGDRYKVTVTYDGEDLYYEWRPRTIFDKE